jgi:tetratricopeptide (TPR) repeat protein
LAQEEQVAEVIMPSMLGDRIREARRRLNMTQGELAGNDYSVSYISAIERNKIRPSLRALAWLASKLNVNLSDLVATESPLYGDAGEAEEVQTALTNARIALANRQFAEARSALLPVRELAKAPSQKIAVSLLLAEALIGLSDGQGAREAAEQAQQLTHDADPVTQEYVKNVLGQAYYTLGMYILAQEYHRQCLAAVESGVVRDPSFHLSVLSNLGNDLLQMNQQAEAIEYFKRATELGENLRTPQSTAALYWKIGSDLRREGQLPQAQRYADLAMEHLRSATNRAILVRVESSLGLAQAEKGEAKGAEEILRHALEQAERTGDPQGHSIALASLSRVQLGRGKINEALQSAQGALNEARKSKENEALGRAYLALAEAQTASDDIDHAEENFKKGLDLLNKAHSMVELARAYERYADLLAKSGKVDQAYNYLKQARSIAAPH